MKHKTEIAEKPIRYRIRDQIEDVIKERGIDRARFREYSKLKYRSVIRGFNSRFCVGGSSPSGRSLSFRALRFAPGLERRHIDCFFRTRDWPRYLDAIKSAVPQDEPRLFLLLEEGWVYEGYADELFAVLCECGGCLSDFYILSPKFRWVIAVSSIDDNAVFIC